MTNFLLNKGLSGRSLMRTSAEGPSVDHSKLDIALLLGSQFHIWETESVRRYFDNLCGLVFFAADSGNECSDAANELMGN